MANPEIMTVEQAECLLVGLLKVGCARRKQADDPPSGAGRFIQNLITPPQVRPGQSPTTVTHPGFGAGQAALIGTGIGGAAGLVRALMDKERRKRLLQETLQGAVLGGGVAGGLGAAAYGGNWLTSYTGSPEQQAPTRIGEAIRRGNKDGWLSGVNYALGNGGPNDTRDPATSTVGAGLGGLGVGSLGLAGGRAIDTDRAEAARTAPTRTGAEAHDARVSAHEANLTQRIQDLAHGNRDVARQLNQPAPGGAQTHRQLLDALHPSPTVTASQLGMHPAHFDALASQARAHGRPTHTPVPPLAVAPRRFGYTLGGTLGSGVLGSILGSHVLPALAGSNTPRVVGAQ